MEGNNIILKDEMYYIRLRERFVTDPVIKELQRAKLYVIERAFPSYILNTETKDLTAVYEPETQRLLDKINKDEAEYIEMHYPEIIRPSNAI